MKYLAHRMAASPDHPGGQAVCFWHHGPSGSICKDEANYKMSHACPVFLDDNSVGGQMHSAEDHKRRAYVGRWPGHEEVARTVVSEGATSPSSVAAAEEPPSSPIPPPADTPLPDYVEAAAGPPSDHPENS